MWRGSQNDSPFHVVSEVDPNVQGDPHGLSKGGLLSSPPRESPPDVEDSRTLFSSSGMQDDDDYSDSSTMCNDSPQNHEGIKELYITVPSSVGWVPEEHQLAKSTSHISCLIQIVNEWFQFVRPWMRR